MTKPYNLTLIIIVLGFILGIFLQDNLFLSPFEIFLLIFITFSGVILTSLYQKFFTPITLFLLSSSVGILLHYSHYQSNSKEHYTHKLKQNTPYILEGTIEDINKKTAFISLQKANNQIPTFGTILIHFKDSISSQYIGKYILFQTKLSEISSPKNPFQFDYQEYMRQKNIFWRGYLSADNFKLQENKNPSLKLLVKEIQLNLANSLNKYPFSQETKAITKALLLGLKDDIDEDTYQSYVDAGAIHILAISGLHIGIISWFLLLVLRHIFPKKKYKPFVIIAVILSLWGYAFISGASASVLRAVTMFSFLHLASLLHNRQGGYDNLFLSLFVLLLFNPFFLFDVGFQLSYLAIFAIVTLVPLFQRYYYPENKVILFFYQLLIVSFSAQIGVLPLSLYYFHQFPALFFLTNLCILPFLEIIMLLGIFILACSSFSILPKFLLTSYNFLIEQMNAIISYIASFEDFVFREIYFDKSMLATSFLSIITLCFYLHFKKKKILYTCLFSILSFQFILFYNKYQLETKNNLFIFSQYKTPIIGVKEGNSLCLLHNNDSINSYFISNIRTKTNLYHIEEKKLPNFFHFQGDNFLIVDDFYKKIDTFPQISYLILSKSPKIHLERLIKQTKPKYIIADASNKKWQVARWEKTCHSFSIPFYNIAEKGAFIK